MADAWCGPGETGVGDGGHEGSASEREHEALSVAAKLEKTACDNCNMGTDTLRRHPRFVESANSLSRVLVTQSTGHNIVGAILKLSASAFEPRCTATNVTS